MIVPISFLGKSVSLICLIATVSPEPQCNARYTEPKAPFPRQSPSCYSQVSTRVELRSTPMDIRIPSSPPHPAQHAEPAHPDSAWPPAAPWPGATLPAAGPAASAPPRSSPPCVDRSSPSSGSPAAVGERSRPAPSVSTRNGGGEEGDRARSGGVVDSRDGRGCGRGRQEGAALHSSAAPRLVCAGETESRGREEEVRSRCRRLSSLLGLGVRVRCSIPALRLRSVQGCLN